jgi:hypothetical protein
MEDRDDTLMNSSLDDLHLLGVRKRRLGVHVTGGGVAEDLEAHVDTIRPLNGRHLQADEVNDVSASKVSKSVKTRRGHLVLQVREETAPLLIAPTVLGAVGALDYEVRCSRRLKKAALVASLACMFLGHTFQVDQKCAH